MVLLLTFMRAYVRSSTDIPSRSNALFLCPTSNPEELLHFYIPILVRIHSKLCIQSTIHKQFFYALSHKNQSGELQLF